MENNYVLCNGELYHYGVTGMKWGVRRYQNKDGSLTPAGSKRYDRDVRENNEKKKDNRIIIDGPNPRRWVKEDLDRSKKIVDASSDMVRQLNNIPKKSSKKKKLNLSNMSDKELRDKINRANLERQYNDLFAKENVSKLDKGKSYARSVLEIAGTTLTIGSSALGIALAIKELRG